MKINQASICVTLGGEIFLSKTENPEAIEEKDRFEEIKYLWPKKSNIKSKGKKKEGKLFETHYRQS